VRSVIYRSEFYLIVVFQNRSRCHLLFEYCKGEAKVPQA
jgi:hypothetical protein